MTEFLRADGVMHRVYRATVSDVNPVKRSIIATINTDAIDSYGTVVDPNGVDLSEYNKIVLWEHGLDTVNRGSLPIGTNAFIRAIRDNNRSLLRAETRFYAKGSKGDEFTENLFEMYRDGDLNGFSVNGQPDMSRCSKPTREELKARPELEKCGMIFRSWKLQEYSACVFPVNKECVTLEEARCIIRAAARGLALPPELVDAAQAATASEIQENLPPLGGRPYAEYRSEVLGKIHQLFDPQKLEADLKMMADYERGVV